MARTLCERLWPRIKQVESGCWEWQGAMDKLGYGFIRMPDRVHLVHRVVWRALVAPLTLGLTLDHLCRNASCCNPRHLEEVTQRENVLRGLAPSAVHARKTHCIRGHLFDESNTRIYVKKNGRKARVCRSCKRLRDGRDV